MFKKDLIPNFRAEIYAQKFMKVRLLIKVHKVLIITMNEQYCHLVAQTLL